MRAPRWLPALVAAAVATLGVLRGRRGSRRRSELRAQVPDELPDVPHGLSGAQSVRRSLSPQRVSLPEPERQHGQRRREGTRHRPRSGGIQEDVPRLRVARQDRGGCPAVGHAQRRRADQPAGLGRQDSRGQHVHVERHRGRDAPVRRRLVQRHADLHDAAHPGVGLRVASRQLRHRDGVPALERHRRAPPSHQPLGGQAAGRRSSRASVSTART